MKKPSHFQQLVWEEIEKIPYGKTMTYKEIAIKIGRPKSRAVANLWKNHLSDHVIE